MPCAIEKTKNILVKIIFFCYNKKVPKVTYGTKRKEVKVYGGIRTGNKAFKRRKCFVKSKII